MQKSNVVNDLMKCYAIIPARGGSKGIPRKNLCQIGGKPLIAYIIASALKAKSVSKVIVSTDDSEIASVSTQYGAEFIIRPPEISGDLASSESAILHTLEYLKDNDDIPEITVFLQCTSPLTQSEDIDSAIQLLLKENADTAFSATQFYHFLWKNDESNNAVEINHDKKSRKRRQDCDIQYLENGAIYVMKTQGFLKRKHRFFGKTVIFSMPLERSFEIDNPIDLEIVETIIRERIYQHKIDLLPIKIDALILDFDGVFTDNRVIINQDGKESVICSRSDGLGIDLIKKLNIPVYVISTEMNSTVEARCKKLSIPCVQNISDKLTTLQSWLEENRFTLSNTIYLGNDINDLQCIASVGCGIAVYDAHPDVKTKAKIILSQSGGHGAIRELADLIQKKMESDNAKKD